MKNNKLRGYDTKRRRKIAEIGEDKVSQLLSEVPVSTLRRIFKGARPPNGFRAGSDSAYRRMSNLLADRIARNSGATATDEDYAALEYLWRHLLSLKLNADNELEAYIDEISETDSDDLDEMRNPNPTDNKFAEDCFSANQSLSRESIQDAFLLAPFELTEGLAARISSLPSQSDIAERKKLAELPDRIASLEQSITANQQDIRQIERSVRWSSDHISEAEESIARLPTHSDLDRIKSELKLSTEGSFSSLEKTLSANNDQTQSKIDKIDKLIDSSLEELESLKSFRAENQDQTERLLGRISEIESQLLSISSSSAHNENRELNLGLSPRNSRLSAAKALTSPASQIEPLDSLETLAEFLLDTVECLGVRKKWRKPVATILTAALIDGKALAISGSYANYFATSIAQAVSQEYQVVSTPVGALAPLGVTDYLDENQENMSALVLRNATLSQASIAFDDLLERLSALEMNGEPGWFPFFSIATLGEEGMHIAVDAAFRRNSLFLDLDLIPMSKGSQMSIVSELARDTFLSIRRDLLSREAPRYLSDFIDSLELPTANCHRQLESSFLALLHTAEALTSESDARALAAELFLYSAVQFRYGSDYLSNDSVRSFAEDSNLDLERSRLLA